MEAEKKRPQPPEARPRPGATRCPYCHEECEAGDGACACAACLSRHHVRCWEEGAGCGSCRATAPLVAAAAPTERTAAYARTVDAWLRLALTYNAILVVESILLVNVKLLSLAVVIPPLALGAFLANLCFLTGPGLELVANRLGYRGEGLRRGLFFLGTLFAMGLALVWCTEVWLR
jgi:hypothetical protein